MGSLSSPTPAGAHCLWPLCSHTCCLDAEQRVRKCKPQTVKALTHSGPSASASEEDTFPVITLVDASEWLDAGLLAGASSHGSGNDFSDISWVALPMGALRREDVSIPTYSSDVSDHLEAHREHDTPKIKTIHIDLPPTDTSTSQPSKAMLMWVPSSRSPPPPDYRHGSKSPRLTVKELIFQPVGDMDTPVDNKMGLNGIKWKSVQRQTCNIQSVHSQPDKTSSSEDRADYVPLSLYPALIPSSLYQPNSSLTGRAKCRRMAPDMFSRRWTR
ncbi:uncharacterized protein LOC125012409 isoform X3 [Mugil cephalus]|uniref:uncharacterized protein LOC125012409 isoform X3 n=1 Tax=Mugil cephalus TaxID=48193 RepID=UPI001FB7D731|nr:uncharacterized protein LOC125012409 isoform X3 [Mugil cephalus]